MIKTDQYGRLPAKLERDVRKWMLANADRVGDATTLAEEAASEFELYEDKVDWTIPEIVYEMSMEICTNLGLNEADEVEGSDPTSSVLQLAKKHLNNGANMASSAQVSYDDAMTCLKRGDTASAGKRALDSLAYSVGILHADHKKAKEQLKSMTESDDGETVHHGEHSKGACEACGEQSPSLSEAGLCPECAHDMAADDAMDEAADVLEGANGLTKHLAGKDGFTACGENSSADTLVDSVKDTTCYYCKLSWDKAHDMNEAKPTSFQMQVNVGSMAAQSADILLNFIMTNGEDVTPIMARKAIKSLKETGKLDSKQAILLSDMVNAIVSDDLVSKGAKQFADRTLSAIISSMDESSLTEAEEESSRAIDKISTRIMDKLQSFQIKAGYTNSTIEQKKAAVKYAAEALPKMKELKARIEKSDDPGSAYLYDGFISRLERQANKKLDEAGQYKTGSGPSQIGTKYQVSPGSGIDSGKIVTMVDKSAIKTDGKGVPTNVPGAYKPIDWNKEAAVQHADGTFGTVPKNRLQTATARNYTKVTEAMGKMVSDKQVIDAFLDKKSADSKKLSTDGTRLDGSWMGGSGIAKWVDDKIQFNDLGSKAAQTVQNAVKKAAPKNWLKENRMKLKEDIFNTISNKDLEKLHDEAWQLKTSMMSMLGDFAKKCKDTSKGLVGLQDKLAAQALMKDANAATTMIAKELFPSTHMDSISMSSIKSEGELDEAELSEAGGEIDEDMLRDLEITMDSDSSIYNQKMSIIKNIQRKMKSGKYDHSLAPKLWAYWVESGAKSYAKDMGSATNWSKLFPKPLRDKLAEQLADQYRDAIESGEYDNMKEDKHVLDKGEDSADVLLDESASDGLDEFTRSYIETALWSSNDESDDSGGEPLDSNYSIDDIDESAIAKLKANCERFQLDNADLLEESGLSEAQAGHDFWLTHNGHGSGFWDREYDDETVGDELTAACKKYGEINLSVEEDGKIYI